MNASPSHLLSCLIAALLLPNPAPAPAQTTDDESQQPVGSFVETVDVSVVNVDVYVTDRQGNPITGLTLEDFELRVDGQPQEITNFYAIAKSPREPAETAAAAPPPPDDAPSSPPPTGEAPKPPAAQPNEPDAGRQQLWMVIYVDNVNLTPLHRNRVLRQMRQFLDRTIDDGDHVMVLSNDRTLSVRQPFTSDVQAVTRALLDLETVSGQDSAVDNERQDIIHAIDAAEDRGAVALRVREHARARRNDMMFTLDALNESVRSLAGLPGRKAIVHVSDGLPLTPGRDLFYAVQQAFDDYGALANSMEFNLERRYDELTNAANANRVSFYTIDAGGLELHTGIAAENQARAPDADLQSSVGGIHESNVQDSLRRMAERTGGTAILNRNDVGPALDKVSAALDSYYSLGFTRGMLEDGRYHEIDVEVRRKGVVVRHREGFREKNADTRMREAVEASLRHGLESNPIGVRVQAAPARQREDNFVLPLTIRIPLGEVLLVPQGDVHVGRLMIYFSSYDRDGQLAPVQQVPVPLEIPNGDVDEARQKVWTFEQELLLRAGQQRVTVAVRDELGNRSSVIASTLTIGG